MNRHDLLMPHKTLLYQLHALVLADFLFCQKDDQRDLAASVDPGQARMLEPERMMDRGVGDVLEVDQETC